MFRFGLISAIFLLCTAFTASKNFPSDIERCKYSDEACMRKVTTKILRMYAKGHKGLNAIPFDPLHADSVVVPKIPGSPVSVEFQFRNVDLTGISQGTVAKLSGFTEQPSDLVLHMHVNYPRFELTGQYSCNGSVFNQPIFGEGDAKITFGNTLATAKANCTTREEDGKIYLHIVDTEMGFESKKVTFKFDNLFNGDKLRGDRMNRLLNDNWEVAYKELEKVLGTSLSQVGAIVANGVFSSIPYPELFLET